MSNYLATETILARNWRMKERFDTIAGFHLLQLLLYKLYIHMYV